MDHWLLPPCGCAVSTFLRLYDGDGPLGKFLKEKYCFTFTSYCILTLFYPSHLLNFDWEPHSIPNVNDVPISDIKIKFKL